MSRASSKPPQISPDFAARLAHEVRSPMGVISQSLEELGTEGGAAEIYLRLARRSAERLKRLAQRLDHVVWLLRGERLDDATPEPLVATAERVTKAAEELVRRKEVELVVQAGAGVEAARLGAPSATAAALDELVVNALRHARSKVTVALAVDGAFARFDVEHDGDALVVDGDADPFAAREGTGSGLGIGLWLCQQLARSVDGDVELRPDGVLSLRVPLIAS